MGFIRVSHSSCGRSVNLLRMSPSAVWSTLLLLVVLISPLQPPSWSGVSFGASSSTATPPPDGVSSFSLTSNASNNVYANQNLSLTLSVHLTAQTTGQLTCITNIGSIDPSSAALTTVVTTLHPTFTAPSASNGNRTAIINCTVVGSTFVYVAPLTTFLVMTLPANISVTSVIPSTLYSNQPLALKFATSTPSTVSGMVLKISTNMGTFSSSALHFTSSITSLTTNLTAPSTSGLLMLTFSESGSDLNHYNLPSAISITILPQGILTVNSPTALFVDEVVTFSITLSEPPTTSLTVQLSVDAGTLGVTSLNFTVADTALSFTWTAPSAAGTLNLLPTIVVKTNTDYYHFAQPSTFTRAISARSYFIMSTLPSTIFPNQLITIGLTPAESPLSSVVLNFTTDCGSLDVSSNTYSSTVTKSATFTAPPTAQTCHITFGIPTNDHFGATDYWHYIAPTTITLTISSSSAIYTSAVPTHLYLNQLLPITFSTSDPPTTGVILTISVVVDGITSNTTITFTNAINTGSMNLTAPSFIGTGSMTLSFSSIGTDSSHYILPTSIVIGLEYQANITISPFPTLTYTNELVSFTISLDGGPTSTLDLSLIASSGSLSSSVVSFNLGETSLTFTLLVPSTPMSSLIITPTIMTTTGSDYAHFSQPIGVSGNILAQASITLSGVPSSVYTNQVIILSVGLSQPPTAALFLTLSVFNGGSLNTTSLTFSVGETVQSVSFLAPTSPMTVSITPTLLTTVGSDYAHYVNPSPITFNISSHADISISGIPTLVLTNDLILLAVVLTEATLLPLDIVLAVTSGTLNTTSISFNVGESIRFFELSASNLATVMNLTMTISATAGTDYLHYNDPTPVTISVFEPAVSSSSSSSSTGADSSSSSSAASSSTAGDSSTGTNGVMSSTLDSSTTDSSSSTSFSSSSADSSSSTNTPSSSTLDSSTVTSSSGPASSSSSGLGTASSSSSSTGVASSSSSTVMSSSSSSSSSTGVTVVILPPAPLQATIIGGDRTRNPTLSIFIDASTSTDPAYAGPTLASPNYPFAFQWNVMSQPINATSGSAASVTLSTSQATSDVLVFQPNQLANNMVYTCTVTITSLDSTNRTASTTIKLTTVIPPTGSPLVSILNVPNYFNPSDSLNLFGYAIPQSSPTPTYALQYYWSCLSDPSLNFQDPSLLASNINSTRLILQPKLLTPGVTYTIQLQVIDPAFGSPSLATATATFQVLQPPLPGSCQISPQTGGIELETIFSINCAGWSDSAGLEPLQYSYYIAPPFNTTSSAQLLQSYSTSSSFSTRLSASDQLVIQVQITNTLGATTVYSLPTVTVSRSPVALNDPICYVANLSSSLLASSTDPSQSFLLIQTLAGVLNNANITSTTNSSCGSSNLDVRSNLLGSLASLVNSSATMSTTTTIFVSQTLLSLTGDSTALINDPAAYSLSQQLLEQTLASVTANSGSMDSASFNALTQTIATSVSNLLVDCAHLDDVQNLTQSLLTAQLSGSSVDQTIPTLSTSNLNASATRTDLSSGTSITLSSGVTVDLSASAMAQYAAQFNGNNTQVNGSTLDTSAGVNAINTNAISLDTRIVTIDPKWSVCRNSSLSSISGSLVSDLTTIDVTLSNGQVVDISLLAEPISFFIPIKNATLQSLQSRQVIRCGVTEWQNVSAADAVSTLQCSWYNPHTGNWSSSGCVTNGLTTDQKAINCSCGHLTEFAILHRESIIRQEEMDGCGTPIESSALGGWVYLLFFLLYITLAIFSLIQLIRVVRAAGWRKHWLMTVEHSLIMTTTLLRAFNMINYYTLYHDLSFTVLTISSGLPHLFTSWIFSFVIFAWAMIYHSSLSGIRMDDANPFNGLQSIFFGINSLISISLFILFVLIGVDNNRATPDFNLQTNFYQTGIYIISVVSLCYAVFFLLYGLLLVRSLTKDFSSPYARKLFLVAVCCSFCFICESTLLLYSVMDDTNFTNHLITLNSVYFTLDLVVLAIILALFIRSVSEVVERQQRVTIEKSSGSVTSSKSTPNASFQIQFRSTRADGKLSASVQPSPQMSPQMSPDASRAPSRRGSFSQLPLEESQMIVAQLPGVDTAMNDSRPPSLRSTPLTSPSLTYLAPPTLPSKFNMDSPARASRSRLPPIQSCSSRRSASHSSLKSKSSDEAATSSPSGDSGENVSTAGLSGGDSTPIPQPVHETVLSILRHETVTMIRSVESASSPSPPSGRARRRFSGLNSPTHERSPSGSSDENVVMTTPSSPNSLSPPAGSSSPLATHLNRPLSIHIDERHSHIPSAISTATNTGAPFKPSLTRTPVSGFRSAPGSRTQSPARKGRRIQVRDTPNQVVGLSSHPGIVALDMIQQQRRVHRYSSALQTQVQDADSASVTPPRSASRRVSFLGPQVYDHSTPQSGSLNPARTPNSIFISTNLVTPAPMPNLDLLI